MMPSPSNPTKGTPAMQNDLSHLKVGDTIAIPNTERNWRSNTPPITHRLYRVTKRTPTQAEAVNVHDEHRVVRVRVSDGKQIGKNYSRAVAATPDIIAQHNTEVAALNRWNKARARLGDLEGTQLRRHDLTIEQMEVLADAWDRVKAMGKGGVA